MKIKFVIITILVLIITPLMSCSCIQQRLDISGIKDLVGEIEDNFHPGNPETFEDYVKSIDFDRDTAPVHLSRIKVSGLEKWHLKHPHDKNLIFEKLTFPSEIQNLYAKKNAVFYLYRRGELEGRKVIVWVPGMGVSDFAFNFIKKFFIEEMKRDYDILFYVPPCHLDRIFMKDVSGPCFITANTRKNIDLILNSVREIRTAVEYLKHKKVHKIGGWGGSIGASMLLLSANIINYDHLCVMIPLIDFESVLVNNEYMKDITDMIMKTGFDMIMKTGFDMMSVRKAYGKISPINYPINVKSDRIQIFYGKYDQLISSHSVVAYAKKRKISNIKSYNRSHATILLNDQMIDDYGRFLDSLR